jgi:hypothetical protein
MKKLPLLISKNGFEYKLLRRTEKKALYAQSLGNTLIGYEVFRIRIQQTRFSALLGAIQTSSEKFPGNENFGKSAWSYMDFQNALEKYNEL